METVIKIKGMTCMHCVATIREVLEKVAGVHGAAPDLSSGTVHVEGQDLDRQALIRAIAEAGYEPLGN